MPLDEAAMRRNVVEPSDIIVSGMVTDISANVSATNPDSSWTKLAVEHVLKGTIREKEITVSNWQAYQLPLYNYARGQHLLLFLHSKDNTYVLTNTDWGQCVPSVMSMSSDGKMVVPNLSGLSSWAHDKPVAIEALEKYLLRP